MSYPDAGINQRSVQVALDKHAKPVCTESLKGPMRILRDGMEMLLSHPECWSSSACNFDGQRYLSRLSMGNFAIRKILPRLEQSLPGCGIYLNQFEDFERINIPTWYHWHAWGAIIQVHRTPNQLSKPLIYRMITGAYPEENTPPVTCMVDMQPPFVYQMNHPDGWHGIRPMGAQSNSTMLMTAQWCDRSLPEAGGVADPRFSIPPSEDTDGLKEEMLETYREINFYERRYAALYDRMLKD